MEDIHKRLKSGGFPTWLLQETAPKDLIAFAKTKAFEGTTPVVYFIEGTNDEVKEQFMMYLTAALLKRPDMNWRTPQYVYTPSIDRPREDVGDLVVYSQVEDINKLKVTSLLSEWFKLIVRNGVVIAGCASKQHFEAVCSKNFLKAYRPIIHVCQTSEPVPYNPPITKEKK